MTEADRRRFGENIRIVHRAGLSLSHAGQIPHFSCVCEDGQSLAVTEVKLKKL